MATRGPKTENGRRIVSKNAWKHGITSEAVVLPTFEDTAQFEGIRDGIFDHYQPAGELEYMLAERITIGLWNMRRLDHYRMMMTINHIANTETDLKIAGAYREGTISQGIFPDIDPDYLEAEQAKRIIPLADTMTLIMRYEAHLHRIYIQTMHELEAVQERRKGNATPLARVDFTGAPGN